MVPGLVEQGFCGGVEGGGADQHDRVADTHAAQSLFDGTGPGSVHGEDAGDSHADNSQGASCGDRLEVWGRCGVGEEGAGGGAGDGLGCPGDLLVNSAQRPPGPVGFDW
jgi:hypothetical protein